MEPVSRVRKTFENADPFNVFKGGGHTDSPNIQLPKGYMDLPEKALKLFKLSPFFTKEQLQRAYHKLAKQYHPDVCDDLNASYTMQDIQQAYDDLKSHYQKNICH